MAVRKCKICGKEYKVCPTCRSVKTFAPWRLLVCNPQEYQLYVTLSQYDVDQDVNSALSAIRQIGITDEDIQTYIPSVQKQIAVIQSKQQETQETTTATKKAKRKSVSKQPDDSDV